MKNKFKDEHDEFLFGRRAQLVGFAHEIIAMDNENLQLKAEVEELREYRQKYFDEINRSIAHNKSMIGGLLAITMTPGVMNAIGDHNASLSPEELENRGKFAKSLFPKETSDTYPPS